MYCASCGNRMLDSNNYCPYCGKRISTVLSIPEHRSQSAIQHGHWKLILLFGILSAAVFGFLLGIPAWIMASRDLKMIKLGEIEIRKKVPTQIGMILGILGTFLTSIALIMVLNSASTVIAYRFASKVHPATSNRDVVDTISSPEKNTTYYYGIDEIRGSTRDKVPVDYVLKVAIMYSPTEKENSLELGERSAEIKDTILGIVSKKTSNELSSGNRKQLISEILASINAIMTKGEIEGVEIRQFALASE
jgi:flagellar basal body-associated protein FliL